MLLVLALLVGYILNHYLPDNQATNQTDLAPGEVELASTNQSETSSKMSDLKTIENSSDSSLKAIQPNSVKTYSDSSLSLREQARVTKDSNLKEQTKKKIAAVTKKTPPVQYSSQPLSTPTSPSKTTITPPVKGNSSFTPVNDLPIAERARFSQYEINVHVYDSNVQGRFVLINMTKYKEGDRLPDGPLIAAITPEGVVLDTGSGKALLERN